MVPSITTARPVGGDLVGMDEVMHGYRRRR